MDRLKNLIVIALAISAVSANRICPGAPSSAYGNGLLGCTKPICIVAGGGLRPSPDPTKYYQCAGPSISYEMKCAPGTCFSFEYQVCVHPRDWIDNCQRSIATPKPEVPEVVTTERPVEVITTEKPVEVVTTVKTTELPTEVPTTEQVPENTVSTTPPETTKTVETTPFSNSPTEEITTLPPTTEIIRNIQNCPGSDPATLLDNIQSDCEPLTCNNVFFTENRRFPTKDPSYYYFCFNEKALGQQRCPTDTCFDYLTQECVPPSQWRNVCSGLK